MNKHKFSAALFDLDGVVFDTEAQYTVFWGEQFRHYHPDKPGFEHKIKGQTLVQIFDKYFDGLKSEQPKIIQRLNYFEKTMKFEYIEGFLDYISDLRSHGVFTAVVTSSNREKMKTVYSAHPEFKELFDKILTSEDFDKSKPDPDCYLKGAAAFGVPDNECVVFEDSFNGLKAGRGARMTVVGLATTNPKDAILPYSDYIVADFKELDYQKTCDILSEVI